MNREKTIEQAQQFYRENKDKYVSPDGIDTFGFAADFAEYWLEQNLEEPEKPIEGDEWCINDNYPNELQNGEYDINISYATSSNKHGYVPRKIMDEFRNKLNA